MGYGELKEVQQLFDATRYGGDAMETENLSELVDDKSNLQRLEVVVGQLTGQENELERFFKLSPDLYCVANREGYFIKVNRAWCRELGRTEEELLREKFLHFVHPDDKIPTQNVMRSLNVGNITLFVNRYQHKDGHYVYLEWSATQWADGLTYATARPLPSQCVICPAKIGPIKRIPATV